MSTDTSSDDGIRARISRQSEDALGKLAQELLESPLVTGALSRAFDAREKAAQAQEVAMGALNLPSAGDLERLTRRVRSVGHRMEAVEDTLDRLEQRLGTAGNANALDDRLAAIERRLEALAAQLEGAAGTSTAATAAAKPKTTRTRSAAAKKRAAAQPKPPAGS